MNRCDDEQKPKGKEKKKKIPRIYTQKHWLFTENVTTRINKEYEMLEKEKKFKCSIRFCN